jgi:hypothetical protein
VISWRARNPSSTSTRASITRARSSFTVRSANGSSGVGSARPPLRDNYSTGDSWVVVLSPNVSDRVAVLSINVSDRVAACSISSRRMDGERSASDRLRSARGSYRLSESFAPILPSDQTRQSSPSNRGRRIRYSLHRRSDMSLEESTFRGLRVPPSKPCQGVGCGDRTHRVRGGGPPKVEYHP